MFFKLHLLKFYAFWHNKKFANYIDSKYDWDDLLQNMNKKINHIMQYKNIINYNTGNHAHVLDESGFNILYHQIISNCNPNLKISYNN